MLAKKNRLTKKEFDTVYKNGKKIHSSNFFVVFIFDKDTMFAEERVAEERKVSVVAPAKKFKKAFMRNKKRRQLYSVIRESGFLKKENLKNVKIIIFFKNNEKAERLEVKEEVEKILKTIAR